MPIQRLSQEKSSIGSDQPAKSLSIGTLLMMVCLGIVVGSIGWWFLGDANAPIDVVTPDIVREQTPALPTPTKALEQKAPSNKTSSRLSRSPPYFLMLQFLRRKMWVP